MTERHSSLDQPRDFVEKDEDQRAAAEATNALKQFDRVSEIIRQSTTSGPRFRIRPSTLLELNRLAIDGLRPDAGTYRQGSITITGTQHIPPSYLDVPLEVDLMCEYVMAYWSEWPPARLAAYVMWRLNWIHPFADGNGRTSRAISYLVLCCRLGHELPGTKTIPERIAENKTPYYKALDAADQQWKNNNAVDVSAMEALICGHLAKQLLEIHSIVSGTEKPGDSSM